MWASDLKYKLDETNLEDKEQVHNLFAKIIQAIEWIEEDMNRIDRTKQDNPDRYLDSW